MVRCQYCAYSSKWSSNLRKHEYAKHGDAYNCQSCSKSFNRKDSLNRHINTVHNVKRQEKEETGNVLNMFICEFCPYTSNRSFNVKIHTKRKHMRKTDEYGTCKFIDEAHSQQKYEIYDENEDKHLEKLLLRMNSAFERKNELGKKAKEMIEKYELDVDTMPEEVQEVVNLHMKVEKLEKRKSGDWEGKKNIESGK